MSENNQAAGGEAKAGADGAGQEQKVNLVASNQKAREAILAKSSGTSPVQEEAKSDEAKDKSEIGAQQSETVDSEGDDKSSVDKTQNKNEKPKGNLEKALQEEREKRKKANLEARQLREKFDADMAALRKENDELKKSKQDDITDGDEGDVEKQALKRELEKERARREADDKAKQEDNQKKANEVYQTNLNKTHDELKEAGIRGFKFCVPLVREAMLKRFNDGEFQSTEELNDPANWKKVYTEDVFPTVKDEFPASNDKEALDKKLEAKKKAGGISNPGPTPKENIDEEKPAPTLEQMNKEYLAERQQASRKVGA